MAGLSAEESRQLLAGAEPPAILATLRQHARTAQDDALAVLGALAMAPPVVVAAAAAEALGDLQSPAAAQLASELAHTADTRAVRRGARRALFRLGQAGISPEPAESDARTAGPAAPTFVQTALLSSSDPEGGRLLWLALEVPIQGRCLADGLIYDSGRIDSFTVNRMSRGEFNEYTTRRVAEIEATGSFLISDVPPAYALDLLTTIARQAVAQRRGVPPDYAIYERYLISPVAPPPAPVYAHLRAAEVRFRPDLLEQSPEVLQESELQGWSLAPEAVAPALEVRQQRGASRLALPPEAQEEQAETALRQIVATEFGGSHAAIWRRRLEEIAYHLVRHERLPAARLALAAALEFDPSGPPPYEHPWVRGLVERSVARALGEDTSAAQERRAAAAGLWVPSMAQAAASERPTREVQPSGLIIPR